MLPRVAAYPPGQRTVILNPGCPAGGPGKLLQSRHTLEILIELYGVGVGVFFFFKLLK